MSPAFSPFRTLAVLCVFLLLFSAIDASSASLTDGEFDIAASATNEVARHAAFDGTNFLVAIRGHGGIADAISAQRVEPSGALLGPRISLGRTGGTPLVSFDGTKYLVLWSDNENPVNTDIYGQFVSTAGTLLNTPFQITSESKNQDFEAGGVAFDGISFFVVWTDFRLSTDNKTQRYVFGRRVLGNGSLGAEIRISSDFGHLPSIAFDGTRHLVTWVDDRNNTTVLGQMISATGDKVGDNFVIDATPALSAKEPFVVFDGSRFIVHVYDSAGADKWESVVRFVTADGAVSSVRTTLHQGPTIDGAKLQAVDGSTYLVTFSDASDPSAVTVRGRFFTTNFRPQSGEFDLFSTSDPKIPFGTKVLFDGSRYFAVATRAVVDSGTGNVSEGDVLGLFFSQPVRLRTPNGGEVIPSGSLFAIEWDAVPDAISFRLFHSMNNGLTWKRVTDYSGFWSILPWEAPVVRANKRANLLKIVAYDGDGAKIGDDVSNGPFTIEVVRLTSPSKGDILTAGSPATITWTTEATKRDVASVKILLTLNGGRTWKTLATLPLNPGSLPWIVPSVSKSKDRCRVKVILKDSAGRALGSDSSGFFSIKP